MTAAIICTRLSEPARVKKYEDVNTAVAVQPSQSDMGSFQKVCRS